MIIGRQSRLEYLFNHLGNCYDHETFKVFEIIYGVCLTPPPPLNFTRTITHTHILTHACTHTHTHTHTHVRTQNASCRYGVSKEIQPYN